MTHDLNIFDVIIVGGGAAGLMCAIAAAQRGRRVLVIESTKRVGKKILMSGGGRCNFTNLYINPDCYLSNNPHFCKSALSRYTQWDFIELVKKHAVPYHEKSSCGDMTGQLFCDNSSKDIVNMLLAECQQAGVIIKTQCSVELIEKQTDFIISTNLGKFVAKSLVIATGGLSIPTMGATGFAYDVARQFGMRVLPTRAGLVPFTLAGTLHECAQRLSGVSMPVILKNQKQAFFESLLFTHRGLSGPAVLQLSSYWRESEFIEINLLPGIDAYAMLLEYKKTHPSALLRTLLSKQLEQALPRNVVLECEALWWPEQKDVSIQEISNQLLAELAQQLNAWRVKPAGTEGYRTAEVTMGGVDTDDLSSKTMESKTQAGLFFIGEAVDVTGHLGGFNFQWAWSSAYVAAQYV